MLSWEDYYKDEAPVKKEETKNPEPRVAEVTETQTAEVKQSVKLSRLLCQKIKTLLLKI